MISHLTKVTKQWSTDGDIHGAAVIHVPNTGPAIAPFVLKNPLGRLPVGLQIIKQNKECQVSVLQETPSQIVVQFTAAKAAVNLRVW